MGRYLDPNNDSIVKDKRSEIYVDKTGLLSFLNKKVNTSTNCICVSHVCRFGKSHAAGRSFISQAVYRIHCTYCQKQDI